MDPAAPRQIAGFHLGLVHALSRKGDFAGAQTAIDDALPIITPLNSERVRQRVRDVLKAVPVEQDLDGRREALAAVA